MSFAFIRRYPLLLWVLFFSAGLFAGGAFESNHLAWPLALGGLGLVLSLKPRGWRFTGFALIAFALGWGRVHVALPPQGDVEFHRLLDTSRKIEASWRVEDYAECLHSFCRFPARLLGLWERGVFRPLERGLVLRGKGERFVVPGEVYRSSLSLRAPRRFRNPHSFDYPRYLHLSGISASAFDSDLASAYLESPAPWLFSRAASLRLRLRQRLSQSVPESPGRGVMAALLLGDEAMLMPEVESDFRRAGLTHVLVVSGLHFGLVLSFFYFPFYILFSLRSAWADSGAARTWALGVALIPAVAYGAVVGLSPSVLRGLGFCVAIFFGSLLRRRKDFMAFLGLLAGVMLLAHPLWIFSLSFQLSFLSVAAIFFFGRIYLRGNGGRETASLSWLRWVSASLYTSAAVNLALLPLLAQAFHQVSWIAPLANLIFVPFFASLLLPAELIAALADFLNPLWAQAIFSLLGSCLNWVLACLAWMARWPFAASWLPVWNFWDWVTYIFLFGTWASVWRWRRAISLGFVGLLVFFIGILWKAHHPPPPTLSLSAFDVGQGESLLLRLPQGASVLVDGGGFPYSDFDVGRNVVIPELLGRGIVRLDILVLSHPDADHWKGLMAIAESMKVGEFWIGAGVLEDSAFKPLRDTLTRREIPIRVLRQGEILSKGDSVFEVLWPPDDVARWQVLSDNDRSLVLRVCYGQVCFLLTGDLEDQGEEGILSYLAPRGAEVLKVGHHGSATSTGEALLRAVRPHWAMISVGEGNRYGLPHPKTLGRLKDSQTRVLRTDRMGQIEVETDGKNIEARRFIDGPIPSHWSAIRAAVFESGS